MTPTYHLRLAIFVLATIAVSLALPSASNADTHRFVLVVANNQSLTDDVESLRFADDDGARNYELLAPGAEGAWLLATFDRESQDHYPHLLDRARPPTRANLLRALDELKQAIATSKAAGHRTVAHVFFTGHGQLAKNNGGAGSFSLLDEPWTRDDMVERVVAPQWADFTHLVIDACNAYFLVQGRGDWEDDAEPDSDYERAVASYFDQGDVMARFPRTGILLSTSGAAEVHEWGRYRAGVFSHQLRSALVGAADVDGDGRLRYDEIEAYIASANAAVANPKARISVTARAPRHKLSEPFVELSHLAPMATLSIPVGQRGHFVFEDSRGLRYADVTTIGDREVRVVLARVDEGGYHVRRGDEEAKIPTDSDLVALANLSWTARQTIARSSVDEAFRTSLFAVSFSVEFYNGYVARSRLSVERSPVVVERPSEIEESSARWTLETSYALSRNVIGENLDNGGGLSVRYGLRDGGWFARAGVAMGTSNSGLSDESPEGTNTLRFDYGLGAGYAFGLASWLRVGPALGVGHLWVSEDGDDQVRGDRTGFRATGSLFAELLLGESWSVGTSVGTALNVISLLSRTDDEFLLDDRAFLSPFLQIRAGYDF